jgi:hypothetical protein
MSRLRPLVGATVLLVGLLVALSPFISVWRAGGQMLGEIPDLEGIDHRDERTGPSAMFDDDFILARRTFIDVDDQAVAEALVADGFEPLGMVDYSKECCGAYDAVWADVLVSDAEGTVVELTAADSDWQLAWPLYSGAGSLVALIGIGVLVSGLLSRREQLVAARS